MAEEEPQLWHYLDAEGTQQGPVTADDLQELATQGIIHPETEVWTEGLDQWVPATHVEGLLPTQAPAPHRPQLVTGTVAPQAAAHPVEPVHATPAPHPAPVGGHPVAGLVPPTAAPAEEHPEGHYPPTFGGRASFGKLLTCLIVGLVLLIGGPLLGFTLGASNLGPSDEMPPAALALILLGYLGGTALLLIGQIMALRFLYRAWGLLKFGDPRTTPGKAVGFLFIPLFNLYWIFVAHHGLTEDWNRIMGSYPDLLLAPRLSSGLALAACICLLIPGINVIGFFLLLAHYAQVCAGINFMAARSMHQTRAGGIHLY